MQLSIKIIFSILLYKVSHVLLSQDAACVTWSLFLSLRGLDQLASIL